MALEAFELAQRHQPAFMPGFASVLQDASYYCCMQSTCAAHSNIIHCDLCRTDLSHCASAAASRGTAVAKWRSWKRSSAT